MDCGTQYENICKEEFAAIHGKLDKLDEAIRGNGKIGIMTRLDRLERSEAIRSKLMWLITASAITGAVSLVTAVVIQISRVH
ncbi:MAG: hypothetical protein A2Y07_06910 [Planctomycetes bacterium GWF2_50_10]|nr:MAG: hypothetical protein A2Y07_06910 [Planctomycetes bacterium GWF2_50_10]